MKDFSRAIRRHHVQRLKYNRKNYYGYHRVYGQEGILRMSAKELNRAVFTAALCSCPKCGNSRKWLGELTIQERRHMQYRLHSL